MPASGTFSNDREAPLGLKLITAASAGAVTIDAAKAHCSVETSDWDPQFIAWIAAATALAESVTGRALGQQTWELTLPGFVDEIELPKGPVTGVTWVKYLDVNRAEQTLATSAYIADLVSDPQRLVRDSNANWPDTAYGVPNAVTVRFVTGFAATPPLIAQAVLLTIANWWADRETGKMPEAAMQLLRPSRVIRI